MKGTVYVNPTFLRKNIKQPTVISLSPLVAYDENRIYFNNSSIKWQFKDIVNCTYSQNYNVLMVLTDDYKIYVFTEQLEQITVLHNWEPKYIVGFKIIEPLSMLLLVGTEQVEAMKVNILTNVKRTKFLSSMKFHIKRESHIAVKAEEALKWNKGYGYLVQEDLLYVWSTQDIHFYSLSKLSLKSRITGLTKKENSISTALFSSHYKYTITGLLNGEVKVWRLPVSALYQHREILIHNFSYHSREIEQIVQADDYKTIITTGLDLYVCFLSIQTFQLLRVFNFSAEYTKLFLLGTHTAYAIKDGYLGELNYGNKMEFICELNGAPISYDRSTFGAGQAPPYNNLQITLNSNISYEYNLQEIASALQPNKINIKHIYPPLKSKNVTQVLSCPHDDHRYFMLVEEGEIFSFEMTGNVGRIDRHYVISKSVDSEKHPVNQSASYLAFLRLVVPEIDTEMIERTQDTKFIDSSELKLLTVGTNRGSVIFYRSDELQTVYCRISYHRQKIINIKQTYTQQAQWLLSICEEKYLKVTVFNSRRASCLFTLFCGEIYCDLLAFQNCMALVMPRGLFQLCFFQHYQKEPLVLVNRQAVNHEDDILSLDYRSDLRLLLTAAKDHKIKIWNTDKILIYEIVVDQRLQYALWGDNTILVFQAGKLYCLREFTRTITRKVVARCEQEFRESYELDDGVSLGHFLESALARVKEKNFKIRQTRKHVSLHLTPEKKMRELENHKKVQKNAGKVDTAEKTQLYHSQANESTYRTKSKYQSAKKKTEPQLTNSTILHSKSPAKRKAQLVRTEQSEQEKQRAENDFSALRKHMQELSSIKKAANEPLLPKIKQKNEDLFVEFMREKLLNKKLLTRRDITLNRIIMKNLIKEHITSDEELVSTFKLD